MPPFGRTPGIHVHVQHTVQRQPTGPTGMPRAPAHSATPQKTRHYSCTGPTALLHKPTYTEKNRMRAAAATATPCIPTHTYHHVCTTPHRPPRGLTESTRRLKLDKARLQLHYQTATHDIPGNQRKSQPRTTGKPALHILPTAPILPRAPMPTRAGLWPAAGRTRHTRTRTPGCLKHYVELQAHGVSTGGGLFTRSAGPYSP